MWSNQINNWFHLTIMLLCISTCLSGCDIKEVLVRWLVFKICLICLNWALKCFSRSAYIVLMVFYVHIHSQVYLSHTCVFVGHGSWQTNILNLFLYFIFPLKINVSLMGGDVEQCCYMLSPLSFCLFSPTKRQTSLLCFVKAR